MTDAEVTEVAYHMWRTDGSPDQVKPEVYRAWVKPTVDGLKELGYKITKD